MSSLRAHLEIEPHPLGTFAGVPPFGWSLPAEPVALRQFHLRALAATFQVLPFDPATFQAVSGSSGPTITARVSTGEPVSVFPWAVWHDRDRRTPNVPGDFEGRILWCEPQHVYGPDGPPRTYPGPDGTGNWYFRDCYRFQLGVIWVEVFDNHGTGHQLSPCRVLARFLLDPSPEIPEPILGLHWGILTNRIFERVTRGLETPPPPQPGHLEEWRLYDGIDRY
jgi:hypothetical protein